jgi:hypothetical protein
VLPALRVLRESPDLPVCQDILVIPDLRALQVLQALLALTALTQFRLKLL